MAGGSNLESLMRLKLATMWLIFLYSHFFDRLVGETFAWYCKSRSPSVRLLLEIDTPVSISSSRRVAQLFASDLDLQLFDFRMPILFTWTCHLQSLNLMMAM